MGLPLDYRGAPRQAAAECGKQNQVSPSNPPRFYCLIQSYRDGSRRSVTSPFHVHKELLSRCTEPFSKSLNESPVRLVRNDTPDF